MKFSLRISMLICFMLITPILPICGPGCVQCKEDKCLVCSPPFTLDISTKSCVDEKVEGCREYKVTGGCYLCEGDNYFDSDQNLCVSLESDQTIPNCLYYDTNEGSAGSGVNVVCLECDSTHYLLSGNCTAVTNSVSHCKGYDGNAKCDKCENNFILNGQTCESITLKNNCVSYTNVQCLGCRENYIVTDNLLEKKLRVLGNYGTYFEKFDMMDYFNRQIVEIEEKCSNTVIENCLVPGSYNNCRACSPGYWLDGGKCSENPNDLIKNCLRYESNSSCAECVQGFFLKSSTECSSNIDIPNCSEYSGIQNHTRCIKCSKDYFLADDNVCFLRTNLIENCLTFNVFNDSCAKCSDTFDLSENALVCQTAVPDCQKYYDTNDSACETCNNGFYLDVGNNACLTGGTVNCDRYKKTENVCELCLNKFYLDNQNLCQAQADIAECNLYDRILPHKCTECSFKTVLFKKTTECLLKSLLGCEILSDLDKCQKCLDNYTLTTSNQCTLLDTNLKCLRGELNQCTQCKPGYILEQGKCLDPFDFMGYNCSTTADDLTGLTDPLNTFCSKCNTNSISLNYKGNYLCVLDTRLEDMMGSAPDASCKAYRLNENGVYQCDLCEASKIVSEDSKTCIDVGSCPTDKSIYLATLSIQDDKINIANTNMCGTKRDNCRTFGPKLMQNDLPKKVNYGCVECFADYNPVISFENNIDLNNTTLYSYPDSTGDYSSLTPNLSTLFGIPDIKCLDKSTLSYFAEPTQINTNTITNCKYYILLPNGQYGCGQCRSTHKGNVINFFIEGCMVYDSENENCEQCDWGRTLAPDDITVEAKENMRCVNPGVIDSTIVNCDNKSFNELKCYGCEPNFFLDMTVNALLPTCTTQPIINQCELYSHNSLECLKCNTGFHLKSDNLDCITDVADCVEYVDPAGTNCKKCIDGKHPAANSLSCIGVITQCQIYDQTPSAAGTCLKYNRYIPFYFVGVCEPTETGNGFANCAKFSAVDVCEECENGYYLFNSQCCQHGFYGNTCQNNATVINCDTFDLHPFTSGKFICTECKSGFHIDKNYGDGLDGYVDTTVAASKMICVADSTYHTTDDAAETDILLVNNEIGCGLFDSVRWECLHCKTGYYKSLGLCCQEKKFNFDGKCETITAIYPAISTDCLEAEPSEDFLSTLCTKCDPTGTNLLLSRGHCCPTGNAFINGSCATLPSNCVSLDVEGNCSECSASNYFTDEFYNCCPDGQYSIGPNTVDCATISIASVNQDNCLQYDRVFDVCLKCAADYTFDGSKCIFTDELYDHCLRIDPVSKNCTKCAATHFLESNICCENGTEYVDLTTGQGKCKAAGTAVTNCKEHDSSTTCRVCDDQYYLTTDTTICCNQSTFLRASDSKCISIQKQIVNCGYFNYTERKCLTCVSGDDGNYYINSTDGTVCCPEGKWESAGDGECIDIVNLLNCAKTVDDSVCTKCKDNYISIGSACVSKLANCLDPYEDTGNQRCHECEFGYISVKDISSDTCVLLTDAQITLGFYGAKAVATGTTDEHNTCRDYFSGESSNSATFYYCCPQGQIVLDNSASLTQFCVDNTANPNCQYADDDECVHCYLHKDWCTNIEIEVYKITHGSFGIFTEETFTYSSDPSDNNYYINYHDETNELCCEVGSYEVDLACVVIPVDNCFTFTNNKCTACNSEYNLSQGKCCRYDEIYDFYYGECIKHDSIIGCGGNNEYKSNGHCCNFYNYWNEEEKRCIPLYDQKCKESDSTLTCGECNTGYKKDTTYKALLTLDLDNEYPCENPEIKFEFERCVDENELISTTAADKVIPYPKMTYITDNCLIFDFENEICKTCINDAYSTANHTNCCLEDFTGFVFDEIIQCVAIEKLMEDCSNYDQTNRVCLECIDAHHLSGGRCCPNDFFLERTSLECTIQDAFCETFNVISSNCTKCKSGSYLSKGHCCSEGKFWDSANDDCKNLTASGFSECLKMGDDGTCKQCVTDSTDKYYLHHGRCCKEGLYWNWGNTACETIDAVGAFQGTALEKCLRLDIMNLCTLCSSDSYLSYNRCCEVEEFYASGTSCSTLSGVIDNCEKVNSNDSSKCIQCESNYYVTNDHCCLAESATESAQYWDGTACQIRKIFPHCQRSIYDGVANFCDECKSGYVLQNLGIPQCISDSDFDVSNKINNCVAYNDTNACSKCSEEYYLDTLSSLCENRSVDNCDKLDYDSTHGSKCIKCDSGFILEDINDTCVPAVYELSNCNSFGTTTTTCDGCEDGYYLNTSDNLCYEILAKPGSSANFDNCLTGTDDGSSTYTCTKCMGGYFVDSSACTRVTVELPGCDLYTDATNCDTCISNYYLVLSTVGCCKNGELWDDTNNVCKPIDKFAITNCKQFDVTVDSTSKAIISAFCKICNSGYNKVYGGGCCVDRNDIWEDNKCNSTTDNGLVNCIEREDKYKCKEIDTNDLDANCNNSYYYTNGHCCESGKYWDLELENCVSVTTVISDCLKLNDEGVCQSCDNSKYVSNNRCCDDSQYFDGESCTAINATNYPGCNRIHEKKCTNCSSGTLLNGCCNNVSSKYYHFNEETQFCKENAFGCEIFDVSTGICTQCDGDTLSTHYYTPKACCLLGSYYDESDNSCKLINTLTGLETSDCQKLLDDKITSKTCGGCTGSLVVRNSKCCEASEINVSNKCVDSAVINNCVRLKDDGLCEKCKTNFHLSEGVCCESGKYFAVSTGTCVAGNGISNCKEYIFNVSVKCEICISGFHVTNNGDNCCEIGKYYDGSDCSDHVDQCNSFDSSSPFKCNSCDSGYNVYELLDSADTGVCCPDGQFHLLNKNLNSECLPISVMNKFCDNFDYKNMKCTDNSDPVVPGCSSGNYFSDYYCCPLDQKRNSTGCEAHTGNANCDGYSVSGSTTVCSHCDSSYYLTNGGCCLDNFYWNGTSCIANPTNCLQHDGTNCVKCDGDSHLYTATCCVFGKYWDGSDPNPDTSCVAATGILEHCKIFDQLTSNPTCGECDSGKFLADNKKSCCDPDNFVNDSTCEQSISFPTNHLSYDYKLVEFYKCDTSTSYLTNGVCCENTKYFSSNRICETITTTQTTDTSCDQYDAATNTCLGCVDLYQLNPFDKICMELPTNCLEFDFDNNICSKCGDGTVTEFYLSLGNCCPVTEEYIGNSCTAITPTTNCNKTKDGICIECISTHYLVESTCCQKEYYLTDVNTCANDASVTIDGCLEYNNYGHCRKCKPKFLLLNLKNGKKQCLSMSETNNLGLTESTYNIDNCEEYNLVEDVTDKKNNLVCTQCKNHGLDNGFLPKTIDPVPTTINYLFKPNPAFCSINLDIKQLISASTLECTKCLNNETEYVNKGACIPRTNTNCDSFDVKKDHCESCSAGNYLNEEHKCIAIPITDCSDYDRTKDLCLKCDTGTNANLRLFYEKFEKRTISRCQDTSPSNTAGPLFYPGFIWKCDEANTDFAAGSHYHGLTGEMSRLFNDHVCVASNEIPVTGYTGGRDFTWTVEGIQRTDNSLSNSNTEELDENTDNSNYLTASECVDISGWTSFPANCALAITNSNKIFNLIENSQIEDLSNVNTLCIACKPGFKPTRNELLPLQIKTCTAIANCDITTPGKTINACDLCNADHIYGYNEKTGVDKTICIDWTTQTTNGFGNCYAADNTATDAADYKCKYCQKGFLLNADKKCEKFHPPFCADDSLSTTTFNTMPFFSSHDLKTGIHMLKDGRGCSQCATNYTGLYQANDNWVCTVSPYVTARTYVTDSVVYDTNCTNYGPKNGDVACVQCISTHILTTDNKCVEKINNLLNCSVAISTTECSVCDATFVVVNKLCVTESIDNCMNYLQDPLNNTITCLECNDEHYLHNNTCLIGEIENCRVFKEKLVCKECKDKFALVVTEDEKEVCFPVTRHINCKQYSTDSFQNNVIECIKCESNGYFLNSLTEPEYVCNPFSDIPNCIKYDNENHIINSNYKCLECADNHYLTNNKCLIRTVFITHCETYDLLSQTCETCDEGYYQNQSKTECVLNPIGIPGCNKYSDLKTCIKCDANLYLDDNICKKVLENNLIEDCEFYSNSETCSHCLSSKLLENQNCVDPVAQNCKTFLNPNECTDCLEGFGIKSENSLRTCVSIPIKNNCQAQDQTFPFDCLNCNNGFYLDTNNDCQTISTNILNCLYYKTANLCSQCLDNYILNKEGTACSPYNAPSNCNSFKQIDAFCVLCESGYELDSNQDCQPISNAASNVSCLIADSSDSNVCLFCAPGYYMNSLGNCSTN